MSVKERTFGELLDMLITTNLKIWHFIEIEKSKSHSMEERYAAGQTVLRLNKKRTQIISAIDEMFGQDADFNPKTY